MAARRETARERSGASRGPKGLSLVERAKPVPGPVIEITPSPEEYKQLCCDLAKLRSSGAPSNTAAVLAAVHAAAGG
jgi:hypothetical protein